MVSAVDSPRFSVVIATYNRANVLAYAIRSVLAQTMRDYELIVVGDCCTDESAQVVTQFGDSRIHWHTLPENTGHQWAPNNVGLRLASSKYVAYLGHDDLWLPGHLDALLPALEIGATFVHTSVVMCSPDRALWCLDRPPWWRIRGRRRPWVPPTCFAHPVEHARRLGGWSSPVTCRYVDPEAQLAWELTRGKGKREHVPRLTAIKFPAAHRENAYRDRSALEQKAWWELISRSADPENEVAEAVRRNRPPIGAPSNSSPPPMFVFSTAKRHKLRRLYKGLNDSGNVLDIESEYD